MPGTHGHGIIGGGADTGGVIGVGIIMQHGDVTGGADTGGGVGAAGGSTTITVIDCCWCICCVCR
jgi:hypothetical protein